MRQKPLRIEGSRPGWAKKIEKLRHRLEMSQTSLGRELNCSAMAVSRWERGVQQPPANLYLKLGNLVGDPGCWYFWGRAGLHSADLLRIVPGMRDRLQDIGPPNLEIVMAGSGNRTSPPHDKPSLHAIPILPVVAASLGHRGDVTLSLDQIAPEGMIAAPPEWCPHPAGTTCLRVKGDSMTPLIHDGWVIVVDTTETDHSQLHGKIVVAWHKEKGLSVSNLQRFDHTEVLVPENREYNSVTFGAEYGWRIIGKVLWWIGKPEEAPRHKSHPLPAQA